jgi:hypothetical protein
MLVLAATITLVFGTRRFAKAHPALVARYETVAQKYFRLRWIIGARIATFIMVPAPIRPLPFACLTVITWITLWRWIQRRRTNRNKRRVG